MPEFIGEIFAQLLVPLMEHGGRGGEADLFAHLIEQHVMSGGITRHRICDVAHIGLFTMIGRFNSRLPGILLIAFSFTFDIVELGEQAAFRFSTKNRCRSTMTERI